MQDYLVHKPTIVPKKKCLLQLIQNLQFVFPYEKLLVKCSLSPWNQNCYR